MRHISQKHTPIPIHASHPPTHPPHPPELWDGHAGEPLYRHTRADLHGGPTRQRVGHRGGEGECEGDAISPAPAVIVIVIVIVGGCGCGGFGRYGGREVKVGDVAEAEAPEPELEVLLYAFVGVGGVFGGLVWIRIGMGFELR